MNYFVQKSGYLIKGSICRRRVIMRNQGFTLPEMVVTTLLVGVLAMVPISGFKSFIAEAKMTEVVAHLSTFERVGATYIGHHEKLPASESEVGLGAPSSPQFNYQAAIRISPAKSNATKSSPNTGKNKGAIQGSGQTKNVVCHNSHSITIADPAIYNAHIAHGDLSDSCAVESGAVVMTVTVMESIGEGCGVGSIIESWIDLSGTVERVEVSGNCSRYMVQ
jgi:prepilin-type N-terminal cleavage/methylation domain-containing protein